MDEYIAAIEGNFSAWIPAFGKMGRACLDDPPGVNRSITDIPLSLFNSVMDTRLAPEQVEETIQIIQADGKAHNVPILWWTGPSTRPADLGKRLEAHGFKLDELAPGMAVDLEDLNEQVPEPAGLSIRRVQDEADISQWSMAMGLGFIGSIPTEFFLNTWNRFLSLCISENIQPYIGYLNGEPVATSLLFQAAGVAGIYSVATAPEARRKGIGACMVKVPLLHARSKGYRTGILQSSEMGQGVYRSLGFRESCEIASYRWQPGDGKQ